MMSDTTTMPDQNRWESN